MTHDSYEYGGARRLVALHDRHLRCFLETFRRAEAYLESVLAAWQVSLRDLTEEQASSPAYPSRWKS